MHLAARWPSCYLCDLVMMLDVPPRWLSMLDGLGEQQNKRAACVLDQVRNFYGSCGPHVSGNAGAF